MNMGRRDQVLELLRQLKSVRQVVTEEGAVQRGSPELCVAGGMGCMHREELRKAYQRRYYKGESGPEILEIEEFWKVLEFWPSQSVDVFLAPGDPVRTSERRNNLE